MTFRTGAVHVRTPATSANLGPGFDTLGVALSMYDDLTVEAAGDVLEIERPTGKRFMVPMRADAVPEWNGERLVVTTAFIEV